MRGQCLESSGYDLQRDQVTVALEGLVRRLPAVRPGQVEPRGLRRVRAALGVEGAARDAQNKINEDTRPDARASTEGAISVYPTVVPSVPVVSGKKLSGTQKQQAPVDGSQINEVPPEDLVSQQGFGERQ